MSGVDVLEVMQRASMRIAELSDGFKTATEAELQEAIVYVSGLIGAADNLSEDASICGLNTSRIDAALRRVKGESE